MSSHFRALASYLKEDEENEKDFLSRDALLNLLCFHDFLSVK